jgi:hypothetical protein
MSGSPKYCLLLRGSSILCDITACSPLKANQLLRGASRLFLQGRRKRQARNQCETDSKKSNRLSKILLRFSEYKFISVSYGLLKCCMTKSPRPTWYDGSKNMRRRVRVVKLLIVYFPHRLFTCCLLCPNIILSTQLSDHSVVRFQDERPIFSRV